MPKQITLRAGLIRARKLIERGWCKGAWAIRGHEKLNFWDVPADAEDCRFCLRGAVGFAFLDSPQLTHAVNLLWDAMPYEWGGPVEFNDRADTTRDDVLRVLDKAIAAAGGAT